MRFFSVYEFIGRVLRLKDYLQYKEKRGKSREAEKQVSEQAGTSSKQRSWKEAGKAENQGKARWRGKEPEKQKSGETETQRSMK